MSRNGSKLRVAVLSGLVATVCVAPGAAQSPVRFDARLLPSGALLAATAAFAVAPVLLADRLPHASCVPCDPSRIPGIERGVVGPLRGPPALASDATLLATGAGAGLLLIAQAGGDVGQAREDLTVLAQAVGTATVLTNWAKVLLHRPRPYRYDAGAAADTLDAESGLSFPSGHTSAAFAAAAAYWSIEARRGRATSRRASIGALFAGAAVTGALRVVAREHFPTDVVAGAVLGTAVGFAVPRLFAVRR